MKRLEPETGLIDLTSSHAKKVQIEEIHGFSPLESETLQVLRSVFKHQNFKFPQQEAIISILEGNDTLTLLPTGYGKSICYQLAAVMSRGKVAIVVSPLLALMKDQLDGLNNLGIECASVSSSSTPKQNALMLEFLSNPNSTCKLIYVSPERLGAPDFSCLVQQLFGNNRLAFFAIDEAHCISTWGHDFRPAYSRLGNLHDLYPSIPIIALTATATPRVKADIVEKLKFKRYNYYPASFNRPEISYIVRRKEAEGYEQIRDYVCQLKSDQCCVIYCFKRDTTENLANYLCSCLGASQARSFHAKLKTSEKKELIEDWNSGKFRVICATTAFGMGMDKSNVRLVIHQFIPDSIESYYQESGRAGRDGNPAMSVVLYSPVDYNIRRSFAVAHSKTQTSKDAKTEALSKVVAYCNTESCRRAFLLDFFSESCSPAKCKKTCDKCDLLLPAKKLNFTLAKPAPVPPPPPALVEPPRPVAVPILKQEAPTPATGKISSFFRIPKANLS